MSFCMVTWHCHVSGHFVFKHQTWNGSLQATPWPACWPCCPSSRPDCWISGWWAEKSVDFFWRADAMPASHSLGSGRPWGRNAAVENWGFYFFIYFFLQSGGVELTCTLLPPCWQGWPVRWLRWRIHPARAWTLCHKIMRNKADWSETLKTCTVLTKTFTYEKRGDFLTRSKPSKKLVYLPEKLGTTVFESQNANI